MPVSLRVPAMLYAFPVLCHLNIQNLFLINAHFICQPFFANFPTFSSFYHNPQNVRSVKKLCKPIFFAVRMWIMWIIRCIIPVYRPFGVLPMWISRAYFVEPSAGTFENFVQVYFYFGVQGPFLRRIAFLYL